MPKKNKLLYIPLHGDCRGKYFISKQLHFFTYIVFSISIYKVFYVIGDCSDQESLAFRVKHLDTFDVLN